MKKLKLITLIAFTILSVETEDEPKIVGGTKVSIKEFPYQAALLYRGFAFCGGSIIGEKWILTAAHCFVELPQFDDDEIKVRVGSNDYRKGGQVLQPTDVHIHHNYDSGTLNNDIAILRVKETITEGRPVKLAKTELPGGNIVWVTGWGSTSSGSSGTYKLQGVLLETIDRGSCAKMYSDYEVSITQEMFCASSFKKDACQGDSGGPIAAKGVQYGVVSFGIGCGNQRHPGVYTNLAAPDIKMFIHNVTGI